jgi:hypothetical protein
MLKLSRTSKLDGIYSWSLQAGDTCPGSYNPDGTLVPACDGCYAKQGNYRFANVKAPREHNREDWKRPEWVADMVCALTSEKYFRWFDSGDAYSLPLLRKIRDVIVATPHVSHWLPTRMYKFKKFLPLLQEIAALPNAAVRASADNVTGDIRSVSGLLDSVIYPSHLPAPQGAFPCGAYQRDGKCGGCRTCYDKDTRTIAYPTHGRRMAKVVAQELALREVA